MELKDLKNKDLDGCIWYMPTDTIPGLSALASDEEAISRIYKLKNRALDKPLIILCGSIDQASQIKDISSQRDFLEKVWPGRVSIAFDEESPIRVPDNKELQDFLVQVGPVVSTSCNISGSPAIINHEEAKEFFTNQIDYYIDTIQETDIIPSTVIKIIR